jgi:multiple sugar transport system permease protein
VRKVNNNLSRDNKSISSEKVTLNVTASKKRLILKVLASTLVWSITLLTIFPFLWMLSASFKRAMDVFETPFRLIPRYMYFNNYVEVFGGKYNYLQMYLNSIKVTSISIVLLLITSILAAYGFSKLRFFGRDTLFIIYLATMMIPGQLILVPKFLMFKEMGIYNSHLALILPASFTIFGVFMLRQYMMQIPLSLSEAARIDGASELRTCFQIIAPLCKPALLTLLILYFTWNWNDYENPLIFIQSKKLYTVPLGLTNFMDETGAQYHLIMAASTLSVLPIFTIFLCAQKYFIGGITTGAVKG